MGLRSSPLAYTILPSSAGGLGLFQSFASMQVVCMVKCLHLCNHYRITTSCLKSTPKLSAYDEKELADLQRFINHKCQEVQRQQAEILS
jgi:hypothetical protein